MAKISTFSGSTLNQYIFGIGEHGRKEDDYDKYKEEFYYQGSANRRAQRTLSQSNPNSEPIGFRIPSESYSDYYMNYQLRYSRPEYVKMTDEEWVEQIASPSYIITGYTYFGGSFDYNTSVINLKNINNSINIGKCTFQEQINISYLESASYISFDNCIFDKGCSIKNLKAKKISFNSCDFKDSALSFLDCSVEEISFYAVNNIYIDIKNDLKKERELIIINDFPHQIKSIFFSESNFLMGITITGKNINKIQFQNTISKKTCIDLNIDALQIINSTSTENRQDYYYIDELKLQINEENEKSLSILKNLHVKNFNLTGILKNSTIDAISLKIEQLHLISFVNEGKLRFNDLHLVNNGIVEIIQSQLSKVEFNYVDFSKASIFKIYLSNLTDTIINNTTFPKNIIGKNEEDYEGIREIYRQLKNSSSKQRDKISELYYERLEMITFEKILKGSSNWNDKIIFWSNKVSNDFGQDWTLALSILLTISLYLYCVIRLILFSAKFSSPATFEHIA